MKKQECHFQIHDPNPKEITATIFLHIALEANMQSIEEMILHTISMKERKHTPPKKPLLVALS
jgi:hypothetical protein